MEAATAVGSATTVSISNAAVVKHGMCGKSKARGGVRKMSSFAGLKPESKAMAIGIRQSTEQAFASVAARCYGFGRASRSKGGALSSSADVAGEIFRVVPIMSGLVLIGIAVGFLLLRVEASVEESE